MRKVALIACVSLLASALPAQTSTNHELANASEHGVRVVVLPPSPKTHEPLRYDLSEPAYVAAFVIYPGSGVRLIYPLVNSPERMQRAGYNADQLIGLSFDNDFYNATLGPRLDGAAYLYVIASRHPIDVARYVHNPMKLASAVGEAGARSFYADVAFDALINNAISLGDDASWGADVYTLWPNASSNEGLGNVNAPYRHRDAHYHTVICADGSTRTVPDNYPFRGCAGDTHVVPVSPLAKPQAQQTASARLPAQTQVATGGAASLAAGANSPTVLPTIVGARISDADRRAAIAKAAASPVMYTAANGDQAVEADAYTAAPGVQYQPMVVLPLLGGRGVRGDGWDRRPDRKRRQSQQSGVVGGSPQLPPNPRLAPNPVLAPAPGMGSGRVRTAAPRIETEHRRVRESMRVPPSARPPQASTPAKPESGRHQ